MSKKQNKNIEFSHISIAGIVNPQITLIGRFKNEDASLVVKQDDKKIDYKMHYCSDKNDFNITADVDKKSKKISVYLVSNNKETLIFTKRMSIIKRVFRKIGGICFKLKRKLFSFLKIIPSFFITLWRGIKFFWREYHFLVPLSLWPKYFKDFFKKISMRWRKNYLETYDTVDYNKWLVKYEEQPIYSELKYKPLISILIPVYNIDKISLSKCLDSILNQKYENFEVCLVNDCSTKEETLETLKEYENKDSRIRVKHRKENGHISKTTNDALEMAKGEFISLVDDDDELTENALYEVVKVLNENKKLDFIYSDEDKLDLDENRCHPNFKPDWSPDTFMSMNYICHFTTIRKKLMEEVGGFTVGLEGAQDYDLFLRVTEKTNNIYHIPKILYHWRMVEGSTSMVIDSKSYAIEAGRKSLENALKRRGVTGRVESNGNMAYYKIFYTYKKEPKVSIIIPTRDHADITESCLKSLYEKTTYKNFEVILVNNNSEKKETFDLFSKYKKKYKNFKVLDANYEFNYSKLNNDAVKICSGDYICLLNNDIEIITPEWLEYMVGYAMQKHVGAVGAKLLYPDNTIQHGGVVLGFGVASHAYVGTTNDTIGDNCRLTVPYDYAAVTAACLVISKEKFDEVGGLDEELKVAYNDIDLNLKLLEKGYYNVFVPMSELYHHESKSRGYDTTVEKYKRFRIEEDLMYTKWNIIKEDPFYNKNFSRSVPFKLKK